MRRSAPIRRAGMRRPFLAALTACAVALPALAQQGAPPDPVKAYDAAVAAHRAGNWDKGLAVCDEVTGAYRNPLREFGPVFGHFYYLAGLCHFGKKEYDSAIEAFKTCYEKFPNPKTELKPGEDPLLPNRFRIHALSQWAGVLMVQGKFSDATALYEKALAEADGEGSRVNKLHIAINVGQCYLRSEQYDKGKTHLNKALDSEALSTAIKEHVFMILAEDWSPHKDLEAVQTFLNNYGYILLEASRFSRYQKNPRIRLLAQNALQSGDPFRTLLWHVYLYNPRYTIEAFEERIANLREELEDQEVIAAELAETEKRIADERAQHANDLLRTATCHYHIDNYAGSYAGFQVLAETAPNHKNRPEILHNFVSSAVQLNLWKDAYTYGMMFFEEFPNHSLKPSVARLLVEVIFLQGEYEEAYTIAADVRRDMVAGSEIRDIPDFIAGASLHHLGRFSEADRELTAYLKNYPGGMRLEPARFYFGSNKVKLFDWAAAAPALEEFIELYPLSDLVPGALYQAALSHFMLGDLDKAMTRVSQLQIKFPGAAEIATSHNLKGDLLAARGEASIEEIEASYLEGKRIAEEISAQPETAAYSIWQMMVLASGSEDWTKIGALYDEYLEKYPDSVFRLDITATSLEALARTGRSEEALATLHEHVMEFASEPQSAELAEMFGSYLGFLEDHYTPEETIERLSSFPLSSPKPPAVEGWLDIGRVEVLEKSDEVDREAVNRIYYRLQAGFDPGQHSNYVIVKLARWNSEFRGQTEEAAKLYEFIIENRAGTPGYEFALLDTALLEAASGSAEGKARARARFNSILDEFQNEALREAATLGIARVLTDEENYAEARAWWERYLEDRSWNEARAEANCQLAACVENEGKKPEALKLYVSVYANFPGHLDWSTRAYLRAAHILKESGEDLKALLVLRDMLQRMEHLEHPGIDKGRQLFENWRAAYKPASP